MTKKYNDISLAWGSPGIVLQAVGALWGDLGLLLCGTIWLIIGLFYFAKGIGRSPAWCLLGFLSIIGFFVLYFLPDLKKDATPDS